LGRHYRLALVHDQELPLKLKDGYFYLQREIIDREGEAGAKKAFEKFYTEKGLVRIKQRLTYFTPKVGVEYRHVRVKELGFRWASCTKNADLYFNWKCMMAPLKIIDYILVHELCHIRYRDHSDVFWNEIDKVMPDYRERKEWLKKHGARFDL
jgi:predicted metal-dependent hydrolase